MIVFHGSTKEQCLKFIEDGIDAHILFPRIVHGAQDHVPGLFVTPALDTAKRFGRCVISIEVQREDLGVPPMMARNGVTLTEALENPPEPQAFLSKRIEPSQVKIVHCDDLR